MEIAGFGCWVCTVVNEDTSLKNTIENGEDWMEPLLELRQELKETQDPAKRRHVRDLKRRIGQMKLVSDTVKEGFDKKIRESKMQLEDNDGKPRPLFGTHSGTVHIGILHGVFAKIIYKHKKRLGRMVLTHT